MSINRKGGTKNIAYGLLSEIVIVLVGIIIPRLVLVNLGSEANGLLSSVTNVLAYLSLLEAGVGTASLHAMYGPYSSGDRNSINRIMSATDRFYHRTGILYSVLVLVFSLLYSLLAKSSIPRVDVFLVVALSGFSSVLSFFFYGKYRILLDVGGYSYININIGLLIYILTSIAKASLLLLGFGVVPVQLSVLLINILQAVIYKCYIRHNYAWLNLNVTPNMDALSQRKAVLVHQVANLVFNNTDVILLTAFVGFRSVSVYSMYALIFGMIKTIAAKIYSGYYYLLGQTYRTDKKKFELLINIHEILTLLITFSLYCVCRSMICPFLAIYTRGVNDINYIDKTLPWLFAAFYLLHNGRTTSSIVIEIYQHFEKTKWRAVFESIINISVSIICVINFGIYGVLLGTIAALLYRSNDMIIYASRLLERSCWISYKRWFANVALFVGLSYVLDQFVIPINNYLQFILIASIETIFVFISFLLMNTIIEKKYMIYFLNYLKKTVLRMFLKG